MNLLDIARAAISAEALPQSTPRPDGISYRAIATVAQAAELESLDGIFLAGDTEAERREAMSAALADPEAALTSFRLLAAEFRERYAPKCVREADDRRTCTDCANLSMRDQRCLAAWRGKRIGNAGRNYHPVIDLPGRCEHYAPKADETDQRSGAERWPEMAADNQRLRAIGKNG